MKILVCTDGSDQADRAIRMTCDIGLSCQAEVTLLGIQETPGASDIILNSLRRGQQLLASRGVAVELVTKSGDPIEEIVKRTQELAYDLVVIGAVRKGHLGPFCMSVKSYKIIKLIKPPVLIVMGNPGGLKHILVCSGGKGYIESAFELVAKIAEKLGASVTLFHVMPQPPAIYSRLGRLEQDVDAVLNSNSELGRNLRRERESLTALGIKTDVRLREGFVLEEISRELNSRQYDLIVAGSSLSTGPLRTYVLGDVTREIVNRAESPVLVARHAERPQNLRDMLRGLLQGFTFTPPQAQSSPTKQR